MTTTLPLISIVGPPGTDKELIARLLGEIGVLGVRLNDRLVLELQAHTQAAESESGGKWTKIELDCFLKLVACVSRVHAVTRGRKKKQFLVIDFPVNEKYAKELDHICRYPRKLVILQCPKQKCLENFIRHSNCSDTPIKDIVEEFKRQYKLYDENKTSLMQYHCRVWGLPVIIPADEDVESIRDHICNSTLLKPSVVPKKVVENKCRSIGRGVKSGKREICSPASSLMSVQGLEQSCDE